MTSITHDPRPKAGALSPAVSQDQFQLALRELLALGGTLEVPPDRRGLTDRQLRELAAAAWVDGYR